MIVWRIQDDKNVGPYRSKKTYIDVTWSSVRHPTPRNDGIPINEHLICGFKSKKQLREWFDVEDLIKMYKHFKIVKYKVPKKFVHVGNRQVTFKLETALVKKEIRINKFVKSVK